MSQKTFQLTFAQSIAFAAGWSMVLLANVFGQNAPSSKCAEGDYGCEVGEYTAAIKAQPKDFKNYYSRGLSYIYLKNYEAALQDYNKAIDLNSKFDEAYSGRGYVYLLQKRYAEAITDFNKAIELNPNNTYAVDTRNLVISKMNGNDLTRDDYNKSIEYYNKLIENQPNNVEYYNARAKLQLKLKNYAEAVADSSKAIALKPDNDTAYYNRAIGNCQLGKRPEAMADVARYRQLKGTTIREICFIDIKFCDKTDDECRMKIFSEGIANPNEISPDAPNSLGNYYGGRGRIYYEKGDFDLALTDFNHALNAPASHYGVRQESTYDINLKRGNIYLKKEKYDDALNDYEIAVRSIKDSPELFSGIGQIYVIKRDYDKALPNLDQAIFLNPRSAAAYLSRGIVYFERGRNFDEFENNRANASENYRQAVKDFDAVIEIMLNTAPPETYLKRAKAYEKLGEREKAANDRAKYQELGEKP